MNNEEIVVQIQQGVNVSENTLKLYQNNLPIIKMIIRPYTEYEEEADLLQESYFSLIKAIEKFDVSMGYKFTTYLHQWVLQGVRKYIADNGRIVRIPINFMAEINRYKRFVAEYYSINGSYPTTDTICIELGLTEKQVVEIMLYKQSVRSIDEEIELENDTITLSDTLASPEQLENECIDEMYADYEKGELWRICESYTTEIENEVLQMRFRENKTLNEIAKVKNLSKQRIRDIEQTAIRKLRKGKAKRHLETKLYIVSEERYSTSLRSFKEHDFTSSIERRVMRMEEIREQMKEKYPDFL